MTLQNLVDQVARWLGALGTLAPPFFDFQRHGAGTAAGDPLTSPSQPKGPIMGLNMSIADAVLQRKITVAQGVALAETWAGQELKQIPGGQFVEGLLNDLASAGAAAADAPIVAFSKAVEAPVDAFLAAKLGADAQQATADANAAIDAQANAAIAFIQLQASNLKQNLALGYTEG